MKIITNYTFKGGVGKTVTAISHAEGLAQRGNKVLLIDIDPQANLTSYFLGEYDGKTLIDCIFDPEQTKQTVTQTNTDNIDIIAGDMRLIVTNDELTIAKGLKHLKLTKVLDEVKNDYDYCIIDCPPYFTELVVNALFATNIVVIPFRGDRNSLFAFDTVVKTIKDFNSEYSTNIKYKGLFTGKQINNNDKEVYQRMYDAGSIYKSTIRFQGAPVSKSLSDRQSLLDMSKPISTDYQIFIDEFIGGLH